MPPARKKTPKMASRTSRAMSGIVFKNKPATPMAQTIMPKPPVKELYFMVVGASPCT